VHLRLQHLIFVALVVSLVSVAYGLNYVWFSNTETTVFGEHSRFWPGDTARAARTNDCQSYGTTEPVIDPHDYFIVSGNCLGWQPAHHLIMSAPPLSFPQQATWIRQQAAANGRFISRGSNMQARVHLEGYSLRYWFAPMGLLFDTNAVNFMTLPDSAIIFFDADLLMLSGRVGTKLILGCSGQAGLEDDIVYTSSIAPHGQILPNHTEKFALVAEGDIKILNTWANGREDSNHRGNGETHPDSTDIYLNGVFFALGESFTFEQQNDADSGYVYQNPPGTPHIDDRGTVYLWGGIAQKRRGYVHRSNNGSTGYLTKYHIDSKLKFWRVGVFDVPENDIAPASLSFGYVHVGNVARDTIRIRNDFVPISIDSIEVSPPFFVTAPDSFRWEQVIPIAFAPTAAGLVRDSVRFYNSYYNQWFAVPVIGSAFGASDAGSRLSPYPSSFSLSAFPNPFNPTTEIAFSLPEAGPVKLEVFDVVGRYVMTLQNGFMSAGEHVAVLDGWKLSAGIHFARLSTTHRQATIKLLLIK
jgi:hypothetical protein